MTDEALRRNMQSGSGNLSNVPLHMADVGTENYDQEFTLGLIENEQGTLELVNEALARLDTGKFGRCVECGEPIAKPRLQAIPYTRHCIDCAPEAGERRMTRGVGLGRWLLFWSIALGGAAFDLATKAIVFARIGPPPARARSRSCPTSSSSRPAYNPGALWGFGRTLPYSSLIFAGLSVVAGLAICYWLFVRGAAASLALTIALGLIMAGALGNCYDRLVFGHVRDFVHFHVDPIGFDCAIFNFADNMLVAGAITLVLFALRPDPEAPADSLEVLDRPHAEGTVDPA